ncbi:phosphate regulon sensor histidine kinase PhoR [Caenimonas soli]|uniref:phosphate regulon sensor histidine kinase PhoR n=1 Tax=Caenimonas soli TaxID=2735555 RepID=UPI0015573E08|nr:phosphate regulon sensor histidine kinase PhoR [Caenimonas soli]NPC54429.1 phosphate regulon sensor histidine kinase PhoR [Caenimonas soli]
MVKRPITLVCWQLAGGLLGWWLGDQRGVQVGLVGGALGWLAVDSARGARVLAWLRRADVTGTPKIGGLWGEVMDRARRALRLREQEAVDSRRRLQEFLSAIQASPNGVVLLDPQGRIEWSNQTAAEQFGFDLQRDMMQQIANLVRDPAFTAYYNSGGRGHEIVIQGPRSSPSRPVKLSVHLHPYGEGRKLLLSRDVTAVEQAEIMRRDFVANVSHEIRTPLTVLMGFVETLQNLPLDEDDRKRYLGLMAQQAHRMQTLVSDLLTLSRLEGSPLPGAGEWTPVSVLMAHCEQEGQALSAVLGKAHALRFEPAPAAEIAGSPSELQSALSNLVSNAVRYTPPGGTIHVRWRELTDGRGEFSVRDTGPGIAPEHISRLTERFYRVDRSRSRETGGTGLGLAIVKHVVQRHGGELKIQSTPGVGSTFAIQFPASRLRAVSRGTTVPPATESLAG